MQRHALQILLGSDPVFIYSLITVRPSTMVIEFKLEDDTTHLRLKTPLRNQISQKLELMQSSFELNSQHSASSGAPSDFSAESSTTTFSRIIKDFKRSLGQSQTPRMLVLLNRIIIFIISLSIVFSGIEYGMKGIIMVGIKKEGIHSL